MKLITERPSGERLGDYLTTGLLSEATSFRGAVAFLRASALAHLQPLIRSFSETRPFELIVGIDLRGTTVEGLSMLLDGLGTQGRAFVFHSAGPNTFHPKIYRFSYTNRTELYVGSGNLTGGGLYANHEAGLHLTLNNDDPTVAPLRQQIDDALDRWSINAAGAARPLDAGLITQLAERRLIVPEAAVRAAQEALAQGAPPTTAQGSPLPPLFPTVPVPPAPAPLVPILGSGRTQTLSPQRPSSSAPPSGSAGGSGATSGTSTAATGAASLRDGEAGPRVFVMTLQRTDVGSGQTTPGTTRRSPEIFIPLAARDQEPGFWGWRNLFQPDHARPGKMDRSAVRFIVNGRPVDVNMMTWPDKSDFRLRSEALRSAGNVGDILRIERSAMPGVDYLASVVPTGDPQYPALLARCTERVRPPSQKRFGYF